MKGLYGDLTTMPLKDVVVYLAAKHASGVLSFERETIRKNAQLRDGRVIGAGSNQPNEYLGQFLINAGHLTEDQFAQAYDEQQRTHVLLGKILLQKFKLAPDQLADALTLKFRETLLSAYEWRDGTFSFQAGVKELPGVGAEVDLAEIAKEGEFRETAWQAIRNVFPTGQLRLTLYRGKLPARPEPGTLDDKLFSLIEDGATIDELALALHATEFFLYQRLYALFRAEVVRPSPESVPAGTRTPPPAAQTPGDLLRLAQAALAGGRLDEALRLARRAHELEPTPEVQALAEAAEQGLLAQLRAELMGPSRIPALAVSAADVKTMKLSAPERYLLSRVDGKRPVQSIIQVSPLQELEALRAFKAFLEKGWVSVR